MRNFGWFLSAAMVVSVLAGGCASTSGNGSEEKLRPELMSGEGREDAKKLADEYVAGFVAALKENNFDKLR